MKPSLSACATLAALGTLALLLPAQPPDADPPQSPPKPARKGLKVIDERQADPQTLPAVTEALRRYADKDAEAARLLDAVKKTANK